MTSLHWVTTAMSIISWIIQNSFHAVIMWDYTFSPSPYKSNQVIPMQVANTKPLRCYTHYRCIQFAVKNKNKSFIFVYHHWSKLTVNRSENINLLITYHELFIFDIWGNCSNMISYLCQETDHSLLFSIAALQAYSVWLCSWWSWAFSFCYSHHSPSVHCTNNGKLI